MCFLQPSPRGLGGHCWGQGWDLPTTGGMLSTGRPTATAIQCWVDVVTKADRRGNGSGLALSSVYVPLSSEFHSSPLS